MTAAMLAATAVRLPGGWVDGDGRCHRDAELRPVRGEDEEWLYALPLSTPEASVVNELLARCLYRVGSAPSTNDIARDLSAGDQEWLILRLWQLSFGKRVALVVPCPRPECGARIDADFALDELPVELPVDKRSYQPAYPLDGTRSFRLPRGGDLEALSGLSTVDGTTDGLEAALLGRCLLGLETGLETGLDPGTDPVSLLAGDPGLRQELAARMQAHSASVEREVEAVCPECEHTFLIDLDPILLFLVEMYRGRAQFEDDVHLLGLHYHWPLREILGMPRPSRRHYVRLLQAKLAR